ncbi:MAG: FkbM family methyltransferase [Lachnospiraceae bacterium]|nr:FkbM family methyltransferase [Lachnospiraceae bacterium]
MELVLDFDQFNNWINITMQEKNLLDDFVESHQNTKKTVFLYGAGHACEFYVRYMKKQNIRIQGIIDSDQEKQGRVLFDLPILSLEEALEKDEDCDIVIAVPSIYKTIRTLLSKYVKDEHIFYFDVEQYAYYNNSSSRVKDYISSNVDRLWDVYNMWEDDKSKRVMLGVLKARLTENLEYINDIWEKDQYWPNDIVSFGEKEILVECGSCDGKTLKEMLEKIGHKYEAIYCFEPDRNCGDLLNKVIEEEENKTGKIIYIPKGTFSRDAELRFKVDTVSSGLASMDESGDIIVPVTTIDNAVEEKVTYIKMDIEGSEYETLIGAEHTIKQYKPKLAVCVYHKNEDMTEIPELLKKYRPDYKFFLRHHNCNVTETVLYAV